MDKQTFLTNLTNKLENDIIDVNLLSKTLVEKYWILDHLDEFIISFGYGNYGITILLNYFPCNNNPPVLPNRQCKTLITTELCTECVSFWDWTTPNVAMWIEEIPDEVAFEAINKINTLPPTTKSYTPLIIVGALAGLMIVSKKKKKNKKYELKGR